MAMTKIKGLQQWCRKMTDGYPHVDISNFTTAWRNGMAFCAIIHRFRPDLIDYDSLSPENVFENNKLAFEVGESELNIPAFLEADDMARLKVPDKLSVITYVSQYYNYLHQLPQLGGPGVKSAVKKGSTVGTKRPPDNTNVLSEPSNKKTVPSKEEESKNISNSAGSPTRKGTVGDKCAICQNKVYLLERHIEGGKLYHRSCFRHSELSPTNKVYTKSPFMSPSLSNEKATLDKTHRGPGVKDTIQTPVNDKREDLSDKKENESSVLTNLRSGLKHVDGVGSKHSIQPDKEKGEGAKKAKVQPRSLFGQKENVNSDKKTEESSLPLSGKEAKKLEKRRQEILSVESSTPTNKGAKRGIPLIFQNEDIANSSSPSHSSTPSKASSYSTSLSNENASSKKPSVPRELKTPDSKTVVDSKNTKTDIHGLQQKFSSQPESSTEKEATSVSQPVARPRIPGSKIASSPFMDNSGTKKENSDTTSVAMRNKETVPRAAPRKSLLENAENKGGIEKVKTSSKSSCSSSDDNSTPRSTLGISPASSPPPALPLSLPPPLPSSRPPPLPTSPPPPLPSSSSQPSTKHSNQPVSKFIDIKSSNLTHTKDRKDPEKSTAPQQKHHLSTSSTTTPPARPSTSPNPTQQPVAALVIPTEKKDDTRVLNGLLASLAGVRGRSASTPGNLVTPPPTTIATGNTDKSTTPKNTSVSTIKTSIAESSTVTSVSNRKHSEPAVKYPSGDRLTNKTSSSGTSVKPALASSNQTSTSGSPEAFNVLNSLKPVSQKTISTTQDSSSPSREPKDKKQTDAGKQPMSKPNNTTNQNKVGNLVKNYLSKSKEDVSSGKVDSKSEDVFKMPLKPVRGKDINKDVEKPDKSSSSSPPKMSPKAMSGSRENLTHIKEIHLKPVPTQSKPQDFQVKDTTTSAGSSAKNDNHGMPTKVPEEKSKPALNSSKDDSKRKEVKPDSEIPQWKKDIEERKRKLKEDIIKSETPSKRGERLDKGKPQPQNEVSVSNQSRPGETTLSSSDESSRSGVSKHATPVPNESGREDKLNWQLEAERRMAAFAMFDSEDESKSHDDDGREEVPETKHRNIEPKKVTSEKSDFKTKLKEAEVSRHKVVLKPVNIDISADEEIRDKKNKGKQVELSTPLSFNNNNNVVSHPQNNGKKIGEVNNLSQPKDNANEDGKFVVVKNLDGPRQSSPKVKRKITVLGQKNQKENPTPPSSLSLTEKKKIAVSGQFDFDATSPSDFESKLTRSTEQLNIKDDQTPYRPPRTRSQRNKVDSPKQISAIELQQQLLEIDNRLTDLELRGRDLEDSIRNASLQEISEEEEDDEDRLMMEWFQLVSEKNDLVREEAELVYVSREQDLEDEQEHLDSQLRYLMNKDDLIKSPQEKEEESYLLQRKLDIVNQRSSIVDSMDEDRLRYEEEDRGIENVLKSKGLWKDDGTLLAEQGRKVANATFYV